MPISHPPARTVIIVPIYKASLSETEELVIRHSLSALKKHDVYFVAPTILKLDWYQKFLISAKYLICPDEYFTSPQAYSKLMLGAGFYQYFSSYSHMLVLQTDAVVLVDNLDHWMNSQYDYIGAPWPKPYSITLGGTDNGFENRTFIISVGNGGLSLRRIAACINAIQDFGWVLANNPMDEDLFFALVGQIAMNFTIPNAVIAATFSLEINPRTYTAMTGQPPMGGHAWEKWDKKFWIEQFERVGLIGITAESNIDEELLVKTAIESQSAGDLEKATRLFNEVLSINPNSWRCLYSLGVIEKLKGNLESALRYVDASIESDPKASMSYFAKGKILQDLNRLQESMNNYDQAFKLKPESTEAMTNKAVILFTLNRLEEALAIYDKVLSRFPNQSLSLRNKGIILNDLGRQTEATACYVKLKKVDPNYKNIDGILARARAETCDWTDFKRLQKRIVEGVRDGKFTCNPLCFKLFSETAKDQLLCAKIFAFDQYPAAATRLWNGEKYAHKKIRIAYISPDFREHPVAHLIAGVLRQHDRSSFEVVGVSMGYNDSSTLRSKIIDSCDQFLDVRDLNSQAIAERLRLLEIDIAVDLAGYTQGSKADIFARRPVPIQMSFLGYPGTMGSGYHDYIIADSYVIPEKDFPFYSEKVIQLPGTYLPIDDSLNISMTGISRQQEGLPEGVFVFCCFNREYKINPDIFEVWIRLLNKVKGSVLWLMKMNEPSRVSLISEAKKRGIDSARLIFASRTPKIEDHLARYRLADLYIDTYPYNAHSTASDVLRAGLPLVTCVGKTFSSRVAGSLLHAMGLPELVASSLAEYEEIVLRYALDANKLKLLREKILTTNTATIFNTREFCKNLEAAYKNAYHALNQDE